MNMSAVSGQELLYHRMQDFNEDILKFLNLSKNRRKLLYDKKKTFFILQTKKTFIKLKMAYQF